MMQPQESPIPGQLFKPEYETVRYGRDSLKMSAILAWNHWNRKHHKTNPDDDFISMSRNKYIFLLFQEFLNNYSSDL